MKPELALMSYGGLAPQTFTAFIRDRARDHKYAWSLQTHTGDAAVDRARSIVASGFLRGPNDVLLMVDHDIAWGVGDATYIAEKAYELDAVVGGLVAKKAYGQGYGARLIDGVPHEIGSDEMVELEEDAYMGAAFLAIARPVLERMAEHLPRCSGEFYPFFIPQLKKNELLEGDIEYLSEDWSFCHGARVTGSKVYLAMKPVLIHHGNHHGYTTIEANSGPAHMYVVTEEKAA